MVAAVVAVTSFALVLLILVTAGALDRSIDRAIKEAFASLTDEDLMFESTPVPHYAAHLRTSPDVVAEARIKSAAKDLR